MKDNKALRYISKQLAQLYYINRYHGKEDIERSVRIITALKRRAQDRITEGQDEDAVNSWLEQNIGCFKSKGGYTYEEIAAYWRNQFNEIKANAQNALMTKALFLQKLSMEEKDPAKSLSISKDCTQLLEAVVYLSNNINYNA